MGSGTRKTKASRPRWGGPAKKLAHVLISYVGKLLCKFKYTTDGTDVPDKEALILHRQLLLELHNLQSNLSFRRKMMEEAYEVTRIAIREHEPKWRKDAAASALAMCRYVSQALLHAKGQGSFSEPDVVIVFAP